jgi:hypothetical protein
MYCAYTTFTGCVHQLHHLPTAHRCSTKPGSSLSLCVELAPGYPAVHSSAAGTVHIQCADPHVADAAWQQSTEAQLQSLLSQALEQVWV